jgi:methylated-DNA-[protein]-cysteine S-methyltransferase
MADKFYSSVFQTKTGWVGLLGSTSGLQRVILPCESAREVQELLGDSALETPDFCADLQERLQAYFSGRRVDFPDKLDFAGTTPFQRQVWQAAQLIPYGETRSYQWVASHIGKPGAARAVGQSLGRNPFPIIVPCHRVVASDGGLGGFTGGIEMKRRLLALEGVDSSPFRKGDREVDLNEISLTCY